MIVELTPGVITLLVAGFTTVSAILVALINKHDAVAKDIKITKEQVQNSHSTNLRDDIDGLHADVRLVLRSVETLREELYQERKERIKADDVLLKHIDNAA